MDERIDSRCDRTSNGRRMEFRCRNKSVNPIQSSSEEQRKNNLEHRILNLGNVIERPSNVRSRMLTFSFQRTNGSYIRLKASIIHAEAMPASDFHPQTTQSIDLVRIQGRKGMKKLRHSREIGSQKIFAFVECETSERVKNGSNDVYQTRAVTKRRVQLCLFTVSIRCPICIWNGR